jgi:uncharacterized protein YbjT (DUF2867 family)
MKILIVGASGGTGRQLVVRALSQGHSVRAWSRFPNELPLRHPYLEHMSGEIGDRVACARAVRGADVVISALGSTNGLSRTNVCSEGTRQLVLAMHAQRVKRLIAITSMGTTDKLGPVHVHVFDPLFFRGIYDDKRDQERVVEDSGLDWVIVRPGRLVDTAESGRARVVFDGSLPGVHVSRAALARFSLEQLTSERYLRTAPYLVEPAIVPWHKILTLGTDGTRWRKARAA